VLEVVDAILEIWDSCAVGIKICPTDDFADMAISYSELSQTYNYLIPQLVARSLGFINLSRRGAEVKPVNGAEFELISTRPADAELPVGYDPLKEFGSLVKFQGSKTALMVNHEYTVEEAEILFKEDKIDLIGFGRPFIHNPVSSHPFSRRMADTFLGPNYTHPASHTIFDQRQRWPSLLWPIPKSE
jgi:2,4-dienoyl-CoA reductase-like NADH-dependent reductase (Old Yellow Enzyme family)